MKKLLAFLLVFVFLVPVGAMGESDDEWQTAPTIKQAYEISSGKLYLEWEGKAPVYQVYMDGKSVASVSVSNTVMQLTPGTHSIVVYPISESKKADTKIEFDLNAEVIGGSFGIDLAALGLDPKKTEIGTPSAPLSIDYSTSTIFEAVPENLSAITDENDRVVLSFADRYYADEYVVSVKVGKDVNQVKFTKGDERSDALIQRNRTNISLTLDPAFLDDQECMVPELNSKYTFTVQLRKYAENLLSGEKVLTAIHQSKESGGYQYTPTAAWKAAPVISYASQTADGQVTLEWEHNDYGRGCEYAVMKVNKTLGIKTGEEQIGTTDGHSYILNDLLNGSHAIVVVPQWNGEVGTLSEEVNVNVQNDWVVAPMLSCEAVDSKSVLLSWEGVDGVENYHIVVYRGDNESLLRFVNLDYSKYAEYDIPATKGAMSYTFTYDEEINPETGEKFKFEVYGVHLAQNGSEQKTATSTKALTLGVVGEAVE